MAQQVRNLHRFRRRIVDPNAFRRAAGVERPGIVGTKQLEARVETAAARRPHEHTADYIAGIVELPQKFHRCIHNHRALPFNVGASNGQLPEPRNPHFLHETEVDRVVHVAECVHVAQSQRHGQIDYAMKTARRWRCYARLVKNLAHRPNPSSAAITEPLMNCDSSAASSSSKPSRSSGVPTRRRGSMASSFWPASLFQ